MLIWGSKGKQKDLAEGQFFCPNCKRETRYKLKRVSKYFTLYFIPLFETKNLGEFVECQFCQNGFDPEILAPENQQLFKIVAATKYLLLHGNSPEAVMAKLLDAGMDEELASKLIAMAQA